jgi:hypothetical protein
MTVSQQPIAHLIWLQGRRAADDVEDYYEVARPGDKSVDGSDPFPVYASPSDAERHEMADGWVLVPKQPTKEMAYKAACSHYGVGLVNSAGGIEGISMTVNGIDYNFMRAFRKFWKGALAASPAAPSPPAAVQEPVAVKDTVPSPRTNLSGRIAKLEAALEPFSKEADRWERRGGVVWDDNVPFPANSISSLKIGDLRLARSTLAVCPTCEDTGKEGRHSICRDCDELADALEPFADQSEFWSGQVSDKTLLLEKDNLKVGDIRRAAKALGKYRRAIRSALSTSKSDPVPETKMRGINTDLLEALKYVRRFLNPEDHDVSYVDDVIDKAEGRGLYATTATEGE